MSFIVHQTSLFIKFNVLAVIFMEEFLSCKEKNTKVV